MAEELEGKNKTERMKALEAKARKLQNEFIEIALEDEEEEKIQESLKELFAEKKIPFSLPYLSSFHDGMEFGISGSQSSLQMAMTVCLVLRKMVEGRKKELEKSKVANAPTS